MTTPDPSSPSVNATIKEQPRDRRPLWTRPALLACVFAIVIAYGSLIPLDFDSDRSLAMPQWVLPDDGVSSLGVSYLASDVLVNLLLYVPLGMTMRMAMRQRGVGIVGQLLLAVFAGLVLSWSVETLQGLMPARVASLNDVCFNVGGALLGAVFAVSAWRLTQRVSFFLYCRLAAMRLAMKRVLARPGVAVVIALVNALIIGVWYLREVTRSGDGGLSLPFEAAFELPYDLGALLLGEAMLVYAGIGCLLLLLTYSGARRLAMNWVVLGVVVLAISAELSRAVIHDNAPDVTGVLLALAAASIMTVTVYSFTLAVKRMNRRFEPEPFDGPDRRRQPHDYV